MKKLSNYDDILNICNALSSKTRIDIIKQINKKPNINLHELAKNLNLTNGALTSHVKLLSDLGIVKIDIISAKRGCQKVCSLNNSSFLISLGNKNDYKNCYQENIPIGLFDNFYIGNNCGLTSNGNIIGQINNPKYFSSISRLKANLLWFNDGYLEYSIPNLLETNQTIKEIQISLELISIINNHQDLSSVKVKLNDTKICSFDVENTNIIDSKSPSTQWFNLNPHGELFLFKTNLDGTFLNNKKVSDINILDINVKPFNKIKFSIHTDFNVICIIGRNIGNYNQDINVKIIFE